MHRYLLILLPLHFLVGCTTLAVKPVSQASLTSMAGQTVTQTTRKMPDFASMTAGKAVFGALGALAMISEGNEIVKTNGLSDPADAISAALLSTLEKHKGLRNAGRLVMVSTDDPAEIADQTKVASRFALDVQTIRWELAYFSTDWTHYTVRYIAKARLIDTTSKSVVAEGYCRLQSPKSNVSAPTFDELTGSGALGIKRELSRVVAQCTEVLQREMFSLNAPVVENHTVTKVAEAAKQPGDVPPGVISVISSADGGTTRWTGEMNCSALGKTEMNKSYHPTMDMIMDSKGIRLSHQTELATNTLYGRVNERTLFLKGIGFRIQEPQRNWEWALSGPFTPENGKIYTKGHLLANGKPVRTCELELTKK